MLSRCLTEWASVAIEKTTPRSWATRASSSFRSRRSGNELISRAVPAHAAAWKTAQRVELDGRPMPDAAGGGVPDHVHGGVLDGPDQAGGHLLGAHREVRVDRRHE